MKNKYAILYRDLGNENLEERKIAEKYFKVFKHRSECKNYDCIIGRYSVLPYYKEVESEMVHLKSFLVNDYYDHNYIANFFNWYKDVEDFTFESWDDSNFHLAPEDKYIVKGSTNSNKFYWDTNMFAKNKKEAIKIAGLLSRDKLLNEQSIVYRKYEQLETFEIGINGLPFTNEWRFFFYKDTMLSYGYYWSIAEKTDYKIEQSCIDFANKIASTISFGTNFFVLDVAKTKKGDWRLVEVNDGQMSGLSENDPNTLYKNLKEALDGEKENEIN